MIGESLKVFFRSIPLGTIWGLVWPQTMSMLCVLFIGLTDMWVAGRIHADVQAAIGFSNQIQALLMVLAMSLGSGAMATVSQSSGAKRKGRAQKYAGVVIFLALCMAIILACTAWLVRDPALNLLQVPSSLHPISRYFFGMVLLALPVQYIMHIGTTLFRASRNVMLPLMTILVACILNIFGDLGFGLGYFGLPAFGVAGLAWSTVGSVTVAALLTLYFLRHCNILTQRIIPPIRWMRKAVPYLLKVAGPAVLTQFMWQTGYLLLFSIMASLPDSVIPLAGLSAGMRLEAILFMPAVAFNVTASIMVGNALGAGDVLLARRVGIANIVLGAGSMSVVAFCMWFFVPQLAALFSPDSGVQEQIAAYLFYNILSTPFTVTSMILVGIMTGAGATIYALVVNASGIWLVRLPLAYFLAHVLWQNPEGVYAAMLVSMIAQSSAMLWVFFFRDWPSYAMRKQNCPSATNKNNGLTESRKEN